LRPRSSEPRDASKPDGPRTGHTSRVSGRVMIDRKCLTGQPAKRLRDQLITIARRLLVDHRGARTRMPEPAISSLGVAPVAAASVPPACLRSRKCRPGPRSYSPSASGVM